MKLSDEAQELIKSEIARESNELFLALKEIKLWLWVGRVLFVLVLGGSVYGYVKVDDYIDAKIALRMSHLDKLPIALAEANSGDFDQAIVTLDDLWNQINVEKLKVSDEFEDAFISNYVWILSSVVYSPNNDNDYWSWVKLQWERIKKNQKFIKMKIDWKDDVSFQRSLAIIELKFSPSEKTLDRAIGRIEKAIEHEDSAVEKSYLNFNLALLYIYKGNLQEAARNLLIASERHPDQFLLTDWATYKASYLGDPEFEMWKFLGFEFGISDIAEKLGQVFELAMALNNTPQPTPNTGAAGP